MIRIIVGLSLIGVLSACGDGRGSAYSSAREASAQPTYVPVTPGATPVAVVPAGAIPVTVLPEGSPIAAPAASPAPLTEPIALTPNTAAVAIEAEPTPPVAAAPAPAPAPEPTPEPVVTQAAVALPRTPAAPEPGARRFSTGPIYSACQSAGRKQASRAKCGCVQWVANQKLTPAQQRRGAGFFKNQHGLQEVRQSSESNKANGVFWDAWKAYGQAAAQQCKGV